MWFVCGILIVLLCRCVWCGCRLWGWHGGQRYGDLQHHSKYWKVQEYRQYIHLSVFLFHMLMWNPVEMEVKWCCSDVLTDAGYIYKLIFSLIRGSIYNFLKFVWFCIISNKLIGYSDLSRWLICALGVWMGFWCVNAAYFMGWGVFPCLVNCLSFV